MKILLRKYQGRLEALIGQNRTFLNTGPVPGGPSLVAVLNSPLLLGVLALALLFVWLTVSGGLPAEGMLALPLFGGVLAPSKNRAANEMREKARAVMAEISDTTRALTSEEFTAKKTEFDTLTARANMIDQITPEAEIARQGGDDIPGLRLESDTRADEPAVQTVQDQIDGLRTRAKKAFGGVAGYARAVMGLNPNMTSTQQQLVKDAAELTRAIVGTASDASGGEYLLPLQQDNQLFRVDNAVDGLMQRARRYTAKGRTLRIPHVVQTDGNITRPLSSISQVGIIGEGSAKTVHTPVFGQRLLTVYKYAGITQAGDETIEDDFTGDLQPALVEMVGGEIMNEINDDVTLSGSGSSEPLAALHTSGNAALIKVTRTTSNRIKYADALNMYVKHTHGPRSFWMVGRAAFAEIPAFELSTGSGLVFMPGMANDPKSLKLLGYPIVISDLLPALGTESDFALINPDFYAFALRKALTVESSIHYAFNTDLTTWRFVARAGGIPIPDGTYAWKSVSSTKVNAHSPFVSLDN